MKGLMREQEIDSSNVILVSNVLRKEDFRFQVLEKCVRRGKSCQKLNSAKHAKDSMKERENHSPNVILVSYAFLKEDYKFRVLEMCVKRGQLDLDHDQKNKIRNKMIKS